MHTRLGRQLFFKKAADFFAQNARCGSGGGLFNPVVEAGLKGIKAAFKGIDARSGNACRSNDRLQLLVNKGLDVCRCGLGRGQCGGRRSGWRCRASGR